MRVLIVNTSELVGGAAVAANRLMNALNRNGVEATMLVGSRQTDCPTVQQLPNRWLGKLYFLWERWCLFCHLHFRRQRLFEIDMANASRDITQLPVFKEADVVHLHWVNQGMLSLKVLKKILQSGKHVVWTMHDLWPATSICHYARGCDRYETGCHHCPLLPNGGGNSDLSAQIYRLKQKTYAAGHISFVTCSHWLEEQAAKSHLLKGHRLCSIPNTIDRNLFSPTPKAEARQRLGLPKDKQLILFVSQKVTDERKGARYLVEALNTLASRHQVFRQNTAVVVLGGKANEVAPLLTLDVVPLGYVSDTRKIVDVYSAADLFVLPSLEDNLPNTIMESMACGLPCVAFHVGGIPEMIDHLQTGYLAEPRNTEDLAQGIRWALNEADSQELSRAALDKVARCWSEECVAEQYIHIYNKV